MIYHASIMFDNAGETPPTSCPTNLMGLKTHVDNWLRFLLDPSGVMHEMTDIGQITHPLMDGIREALNAMADRPSLPPQLQNRPHIKYGNVAAVAETLRQYRDWAQVHTPEPSVLTTVMAPGDDTEVPDSDMEPVVEEPKSSSKPGVKFEEAERRMQELRKQGEPFPGQQELSRRLGCSSKTINNVVWKTKCPLLRQWSAPSKQAPRAQGFDGAVSDNYVQRRVPDPTEQAIVNEYRSKPPAEYRTVFDTSKIDAELDALGREYDRLVTGWADLPAKRAKETASARLKSLEERMADLERKTEDSATIVERLRGRCWT